MATGTNVSPLFLWKLRFKVNTPDGGLNMLLQMAEISEATALTQAADIAARYRAIMPSTCAIYSATLSKSNTKKDSRIVTAAIGAGLYGQGGVDPEESTYNRFDDACLMRFEDADGGGITLKIGPVPDDFIEAGDPAAAVASVIDMSAALAVTAVQPVVYQTELKNLAHAIGKYCHHVESANNIPGGTYTYFPWVRAHFKRIGEKKGGRVFTK